MNAVLTAYLLPFRGTFSVHPCIPQAVSCQYLIYIDQLIYETYTYTTYCIQQSALYVLILIANHCYYLTNATFYRTRAADNLHVYRTCFLYVLCMSGHEETLNSGNI